jgi:hypothetical protein
MQSVSRCIQNSHRQCSPSCTCAMGNAQRPDAHLHLIMKLPPQQRKCYIQVSVALYRHFPNLQPDSKLSHADIRSAAQLNISSCSDPSSAALMQLFEPCSPIASATAHTMLETTSQPSGSATSAYSITFDLQAEMRPGLLTLAAPQQHCQFTDMFSLSSDSVDVYVTARDAERTRSNYADACVTAWDPEMRQGILWQSCWCVLQANRDKCSSWLPHRSGLAIPQRVHGPPCSTAVIHACRQERMDTQAYSNHLDGAPKLLALSQSASPSPCFDSNVSLAGQAFGHPFAPQPGPEALDSMPDTSGSAPTTDSSAHTAGREAIQEDPVYLTNLAGTPIQIRVRVPLLDPPSFTSSPRWNAAESTRERAVVTGSLDSPGIVFYAVRLQAAVEPFRSTVLLDIAG